MAKDKPETIVLKGEPIYKEERAVAELYPGHFVEFNGLGIRKQATDNQDCRRAIALENDLLGEGITDSYAADENVRYGSFHAGQEVNVRLKAQAAAIGKGDRLKTTGTGSVEKAADNENAVGYALEAITNNTAAEVFIKMEVA